MIQKPSNKSLTLLNIQLYIFSKTREKRWSKYNYSTITQAITSHTKWFFAQTSSNREENGYISSFSFLEKRSPLIHKNNDKKQQYQSLIPKKDELGYMNQEFISRGRPQRSFLSVRFDL